MSAHTVGGGVHPTSPSQGLMVIPDGCVDEDGLLNPGSLTTKGSVFVQHASAGSCKFIFSEDWGGKGLSAEWLAIPPLPAGSW